MAAELESGDAALRRGAWGDARLSFERVLSRGESPVALEGLGWALWWLDEPDRSLEVRVRAYELYVKRGERRRAARLAISLGVDFVDARGEEAVATGWMERARSLLRGLPTRAEHGWLALWEGHLARVLRNDLVSARRLGARAGAIGRRLKIVDLEMLARALEGLVLVAEGRIPQGMRQLDEATAAAVAGEMTDLDAVSETCCFLIHACEKARDYDRAIQWTARMTAFCDRWSLKPLYSVCRTYYAAVLLWRGDWTHAEAELLAARGLAVSRPYMERAVTVRLGELRRRQGRDEEAEALFAGAPDHPLALIGQASLALDHTDPARAGELLARFLRRPPSDDAVDRAAALELSTRVHAARANARGALEAAAEVRGLAERFPTVATRAFAALATGAAAAAASRPADALAALEAAAALFEEARAPFESSRARLALARALANAGRAEEAGRVAGVARETLARLGAEGERANAERLCRDLAPGTPPDRTEPRLTPREKDVMRLVAEGLSDRALARRLGVSEHTVHRHVANVLTRFGVATRSAAVALALKAGLL